MDCQRAGAVDAGMAGVGEVRSGGEVLGGDRAWKVRNRGVVGGIEGCRDGDVASRQALLGAARWGFDEAEDVSPQPGVEARQGESGCVSSQSRENR